MKSKLLFLLFITNSLCYSGPDDTIFFEPGTPIWYNISGIYGTFKLKSSDRIEATLYEDDIYKSVCVNRDDDDNNINCMLYGDSISLTTSEDYSIVIIGRKVGTGSKIQVDIYCEWNPTWLSVFVLVFGLIGIVCSMGVVCICGRKYFSFRRSRGDISEVIGPIELFPIDK